MTKCKRCGAALEGPVCPFCGAGTGVLCDPGAEKRALDRLHEELSRSTPERKAELLRDGFIPACAPVMAEAGARLLALLEGTPYDVSEAALARLDAIAVRLLAEPDEGSRRAAAELRARVESAKRQKVRDGWYGGAILIALGLIIVLAIWRLAVYIAARF